MPIPPVQQLTISETDKAKLTRVIETDFFNFKADAEPRTKAMARWYKLWRNGIDVNGFPEEERSNFSIPLILWTIKAKVAKELDILLGDESQIVVSPVGASDVAGAAKIEKWMNWRIKVSLKLFKKLYVHLLQKYIFGVSIASMPWVTRMRTVKHLVTQQVPTQVTDPATGMPAIIMQPQASWQEKEAIDFDGPEINIENLEDWFFPAQCNEITDGPFIRRLWLSIDDLLDLRDQGKIDANYLAANLEDLKRLAESNSSAPEDAVTDEKVAQTGVPSTPMGRQGKLVILNWFGKYRFNQNADGTGGDERATDIVMFYQLDRKCLLGVCRLIDIFPDGRNHFIVSQATLDVNSPYAIGQAEMLEPISQEMDAFHRLAVSAGEASIGPVVFYNPASGWDPEKQRLEPMSAIPVADANGVKVVNMGQLQLGPYISFVQELNSFAERLTSLTDPQLGRQFEQPNAPRTLGQQQLLQAESNVNLLLDIRLERENLREMLDLVWEMDKMFLPKPYFFRVTESDPGDVMTDEDMMGDYDFDIGPVTAISNRAQKTQELMQAFALAQPLMIPQITIALFKKVMQRLGQDDVAAMLPQLPQMKPPIPPEQENAMLLQGQSLEPNPLDNDVQHIQVHEGLLQQAQQELAPGISVASQNPNFIPRTQLHIQKHVQMLQQKAMLQQVMAGQQQANAPKGAPPQQGQQQPPQQGQQVNGHPRQLHPNEQSQNATAPLLNGGGLNLA